MPAKVAMVPKSQVPSPTNTVVRVDVECRPVPVVQANGPEATVIAALTHTANFLSTR
jgi:hypothetical protein